MARKQEPAEVEFVPITVKIAPVLDFVPIEVDFTPTPPPVAAPEKE